MKDRKLAVRYARGLLGVLSNTDEAEAADRFLGQLGNAVESSPELKAFLVDPSIPRAARSRALSAMVERASLSGELSNFLVTLVENGRAMALPTIASVFHELREESLGIVPAEIATAQPLSEELKQRAQATIERLAGRSVRLACRVDPGLLGGAVTRIGSTVYDGSLRTQLSSLRRKMVQE